MPPASDRTRAPGAYLNRPLWQRYLVAGTVAVVLLAGMVVWVANHNTDSGPSNSNPTATVRLNQEARVLVEQDQAPHVAPLPRGVPLAAAVARAVHARVARSVADGAISGPLRPARCRPTGARSGGLVGFSCTVTSGGVSYPFLAAADTAARRVTSCKHDPPPVPSESVPVSSRCRA